MTQNIYKIEQEALSCLNEAHMYKQNYSSLYENRLILEQRLGRLYRNNIFENELNTSHNIDLVKSQKDLNDIKSKLDDVKSKLEISITYSMSYGLELLNIGMKDEMELSQREYINIGQSIILRSLDIFKSLSLNSPINISPIIPKLVETEVYLLLHDNSSRFYVLRSLFRQIKTTIL